MLLPSGIPIKAEVKRKNPASSSIRLNGYIFENKNIYAVQCQCQLGASIRPLKPLPVARADKAEKGGSQLDSATPLEVRACRGT